MKRDLPDLVSPAAATRAIASPTMKGVRMFSVQSRRAKGKLGAASGQASLGLLVALATVIALAVVVIPRSGASTEPRSNRPISVVQQQPSPDPLVADGILPAPGSNLLPLGAPGAVSILSSAGSTGVQASPNSNGLDAVGTPDLSASPGAAVDERQPASTLGGSGPVAGGATAEAVRPASSEPDFVERRTQPPGPMPAHQTPANPVGTASGAAITDPSGSISSGNGNASAQPTTSGSSTAHVGPDAQGMVVSPAG